MSSTMKNLTVILLAITMAWAGYYMYASNKNSDLMLGDENLSADSAINKTQSFIDKRFILDKVKLDTTIFDDPVFNSYVSFTQPVVEETVGRTNPFIRVSAANQSSGF
jgi:hypothetical protein